MEVNCSKCGLVDFDSCPVEEVECRCTVHNVLKMTKCVQRHSCGAPLISSREYPTSYEDFSKYDELCWCGNPKEKVIQ